MYSPTPPTTFEMVYSPEQIDAAVRRLAGLIAADYAGRSLHLLVVLKGAFLFAADLVRHLNLDITLDFIRIASYCGTTSSGGINLALPNATSLTGRHVLIVEDILDTGLSLDWLMKRVTAEAPLTIRSCVLIDKTAGRKVAVQADYSGLSCPDGFLIGYGLDCDERHRHLPGIYRLA